MVSVVTAAVIGVTLLLVISSGCTPTPKLVTSTAVALDGGPIAQVCLMYADSEGDSSFIVRVRARGAKRWTQIAYMMYSDTPTIAWQSLHELRAKNTGLSMLKAGPWALTIRTRYTTDIELKTSVVYLDGAAGELSQVVHVLLQQHIE